MSITWSITGTSEQVTFNGEGSWNNDVHFDVNNAAVTSETITSTGTGSWVYLLNSSGGVTSLNINGNEYIWVTIDDIFFPHISSINASSDTGGVFVDLSHGGIESSFTFTGGSGSNFVAINSANLDALTSGSQLNGGSATTGNTLAIKGIGTLTGSSALTGEYKTLNATKGFQNLFLGGTGSSIVINDAFLTNSGFATHLLIATNGGSLTVTNLGTTYTLDIINNGTFLNNTIPTDFTLGSAASTQTALTVNLIPNTSILAQTSTLSVGLTVNSLTTTDGTITNVSLVSNAATTGNKINTYHGSDNQTLTITGNNALRIANVTPNNTTGDTIDASGFTQTLKLGTNGGFYTVAGAAGDTGKGDVIKFGSGISYLAASSAVIGDNITLLTGHTATDTIDTTLIVAAIAETPYSSAAAQQADITQITNFNTNSDVLKVGIGSAHVASNGISSDLTGHTWIVTNGFVTSTGLTGATGLTAFLADMAASTTFTAHDVLAYNDGTNTYIAVGDHAIGSAFGENIIELLGVNTATALNNVGGAKTIDILGLAPSGQAIFTLTGVGNGTNPVTFDMSDSTVTFETIVSTGAANHAFFSNSGGAVTALTINGNTFLDASFDVAMVRNLNSINASADTGGFSINLSRDIGTLKSAFTFTGGAGSDLLIIDKASLDALTSGSQLNGGSAPSGNMLAIAAFGTLTGISASTGEYKTLNATKGFQILGTGGLGLTTVINDAFLTNGFASHFMDAQDGGSLTVTNVGSTYTLDIITNSGGSSNPTPTDFTIGSAVGKKTALTVNLAPSLLSPTLLSGLTVNRLTTTGGTITSVNLVSNAATTGDKINIYHGSDNQTLNITGNVALKIPSITPNVKTGDTIDASKFTQTLVLGSSKGGTYTVATGAGDTGKGDLIKLGAGMSTLAVSSAVTGDKIILFAGHTITDTIDTTLIAAAIATTPYASAAAQKADITQITNFNTKCDHLLVGISGIAPQIGTSTDLTGWTVSNGFASKVGSSYSSFLASVATSTTFAANHVLAYNDGGNTYIAVGDHAAGTARGEHIIELVGLHTATALGNAGGATTIDIADPTIFKQTLLTVNGNGSWATRAFFDASDPSVILATITSTGSLSSVYLANSGGGLTDVIINGDAFLDAAIDPTFVSHLNSLNASGDTGGFIINLNKGNGTLLKPGFTFTGGSGVDFLQINKASLDVLTSGSQLNGGTATSGNVLSIDNLSTFTGTSASTGEYKTLNAIKGFQILALGGSGNSIVINDAFLTNGFATHVIDDQDGGSLTITNVAKTYTLDIVNGNMSNTPTPTDFTLTSVAATHPALTVNLTPNYPTPVNSPTLFAGFTVKTLTTAGGITSVALTSNTATSANIINTYHGSDSQTLTITGNNALTIGSVTHNIATGDTINASGFTQALTLGTIGGTYTAATLAGDTGKGDVIKFGSGQSYLAVSSFIKGDQITLLAGHTVTDTIDTTLIGVHVAGVGGQYTNAAAQKADITQITNFHTNSDILKVGFSGIAPHNGTASDLNGHQWTVRNGLVTGAGLTGATGLTAFLADVASSTTFAANDMLAYNDGVNTYIAIGDHVAGTARGEHIVELVGLHTATALGIAGGVNTIHIA